MGDFILGMLMVQAFFPLIESIVAILLTGLEALKGYFGIKVAKYNNEIRKISYQENDDKPRQLIGFNRSEDIEEEEE